MEWELTKCIAIFSFLISFIISASPVLAFSKSSGINLVLNPGFENGTTTPFNWTLVEQGGNRPVWDGISHSGTRSIKISIPGTANIRSGYPQTDLIIARPLTTYTASVWGKTRNIGGINTPAARVVELDANRKWIRQNNLPIFSRGTNDWEQRSLEFQTYEDTKMTTFDVPPFTHFDCH